MSPPRKSSLTTTNASHGTSSVLRVGSFGRRRAEREATELAQQIAAEARAFLAGDREAAFDMHLPAGELAVLVMRHALDIEGAA